MASILFGILILSAIILSINIQTVEADSEANEKIEALDKRITELNDDFRAAIQTRGIHICNVENKFFWSHEVFGRPSCIQEQNKIFDGVFPVLSSLTETEDITNREAKKILFSNFKQVKTFMKVWFINDVNVIKKSQAIIDMELCLHPEGTNPFQSNVPFEDCLIEPDLIEIKPVKKLRKSLTQLENQLDIAESKIPFLHEVDLRRQIILHETLEIILSHHPCPERCATPL